MHFIGKLILCGLITAASAVLAYKVGEHKGKTERDDDDYDWEDWVDDGDDCYSDCDCECDGFYSSDSDPSCICNRCGCKDLCGAGGFKAAEKSESVGETDTEAATSEAGTVETAKSEVAKAVAAVEKTEEDKKANN